MAANFAAKPGADKNNGKYYIVKMSTQVASQINANFFSHWINVIPSKRLPSLRIIPHVSRVEAILTKDRERRITRKAPKTIYAGETVKIVGIHKTIARAN